MNPQLAKVFAGVIALFALGGFVALHAYAVYIVFASSASGFVLQPTTEHVANGLTGLVSAVFAAAFGIPKPAAPQPAPARAPAANALSVRLGAVQRMIGLGTADAAPVPGWRTTLAALYVGAYILISVAAIVALVMLPAASVVSYTRSLALVAFGAFIAVATSLILS